MPGGKAGVLDTSIPFGSVAMTTPALTAKQKGCNAYYAGLDDNSNDALATALQQEGVKPKVMVFPTGYEPSVIGTPAWKAVQGGYFETEFRPFSLPNAGTEQMQSALEKYAHFSSTQFPSFGQYESWLGADLMIKGLQMAGPTASHAAVIKALRSIKSYNGNGLLPESINYTNNFGKDLAKSCGWYMKAEKSGFVAVSSQPWCGTDLPGHDHRAVVGASRGLGSVLDGDGVLGTGPDGSLNLLAQLLGRVLVQHVEEIVVPYLEDLGGQAHAEGVALAQIEINHDSHRYYLHSKGSSIVREATRQPGRSAFRSSVRRPSVVSARPRTGRCG